MRELCATGYTPFCPGPVCMHMLNRGQFLRRAPSVKEDDGTVVYNLWWVCDPDWSFDVDVEGNRQYHKVSDLDPTSLANAAAIAFANDVFIMQMADGRINDPPPVAVLEGMVQICYRSIFGINPKNFLHPDANIPEEKRYLVEEVIWLGIVART